MWETPQERPLDWTFRRKSKTHFLRPGTSSPANNTELLYDGSAEARQIIVNAMTDFEDAGLYIPLYYTLASALDYLKGKDLSPERLSGTEDFFEEYPEYSVRNQKPLECSDDPKTEA